MYWILWFFFDFFFFFIVYCVISCSIFGICNVGGPIICGCSGICGNGISGFISIFFSFSSSSTLIGFCGICFFSFCFTFVSFFGVSFFTVFVVLGTFTFIPGIIISGLDNWGFACLSPSKSTLYFLAISHKVSPFWTT